jgi:hypothetical protein
MVADKLASYHFSLLTQLALINIEPVWTAGRSDKFQPTPESLKLGGPGMLHLRLVGFGSSMRNNSTFRHIPILVLGDLDKTATPTIDELYKVLREATSLEALSIGQMDRAGECCRKMTACNLRLAEPLSERGPLNPDRLLKLHFFSGGK